MTTRSPPVTRKKLAATRVFVDCPASPSEPPRNVPQSETASVVGTQIAMERPPEDARSVCSQRSTEIRRSELEAEKRLLEIRYQQLRLEAEILEKRIAIDKVASREETDRESGVNQGVNNRRVENWLSENQPRGERLREEDTAPEVTLGHPGRNREAVNHASGASGEDIVDKLVQALESMSRGRLTSRQAQELPIFDGDPREWLPFKAAMRDSTRLCNMSPSENLARLRACLRGEARQAVSALLYSASEPTQIMKTLEQCFGRPGAIIDQAVDEVLRLPNVGSTASDLNMFAVKVQNVVTVIKSIDPLGANTDPKLPRIISEKLSPHLKSKWYDYAYESASDADSELVRLSRFLMKEADRAVQFSHDKSVTARPTQRVAQPRLVEKRSERLRIKPVYAATEDPERKGQTVCLCCGAGHRTYECNKVMAMSVQQRWEWAREARVCYKCLDNKHRRFACKGRNCGISECRRPHHALLHVARDIESSGNKDKGIESVTAASAHMAAEQMQVLLKVCPVTLRGNTGKEIRTYALLDEGSTITLVDEEIAASIGARGPIRALNIVGATSSQQEPGSRVVCIRVEGQNGHAHEVKARTVRNLTLGSQSIGREFLKYPHLKKIPAGVVCYGNAKPRILIGADNWHLIVSRKLVTGSRKQPAASLTQLGWVLHGTLPRSIVVEKATVLHVHSQQQCVERARADERLSELVKAHYDIDAIGITAKRKPIPNEVRAIEVTNRTAKRVNGRFEVGLPWVSDDVTLPPSYDMALSRLKGIERKMDKSPEFKQAYTRQIDSLLEKGYAELSTGQYKDNGREWYLPHFAVTNPNKPGKVRLVFDAAAQANGKCLNDALLDGPDLLQSLNGILYGFRSRKVALTADIREMFLQIKIRGEDRVAQQFLWRDDDRKGPPRKYVMSSMIFGARSSPFLAHSIRNRNAADFKDTHPLAYVAITSSTYMDDWIDSFDSEEIAARAIHEVCHVHAQAGFNLAGWSSNYESILENVPAESRAHAPKELATNAHSWDKALGILWLPVSDELGFNTEMHRVPDDVKNLRRTPTKREALSVVMSIFDPLGLLSPYTITAKIVLQELWREKIGWDEPLPYEQAAAFAEWQSDLGYVADLKIPRCYDARDASVNRQLHVFCDASEQAYAAVAYWRFTDAADNVKIALVAGKAKVAPLKGQSIPRMELQAALVGARLATDVISKHPWKDADVYLWSDSKTALQWIRNDAVRYTPYVAHRLCEIAELTRTEQWRWVPTASNVADDATRVGNTRLSSSSRWFTGPPFLYERKELWPIEGPAETPLTEAVVAHTTPHIGLVEVERFSSYDRVTRALAYALLFIEKCKGNRSAKLGIRHIKEAERQLVKQSQRHSFPNEVDQLKQGKRVDRASRLLKLDPVYDEDGIIRLNGRIDAANIPAQRKNPPILDGASHLVRLYIRREHIHSNHAGREQLVNNIRRYFWVLRLRPAVRTIIAECVTCKARRAAPSDPVKGNLPALRLQSYTRPFSYCGVDCYGPVWVTIGRRKEKRWGMLFTCLVTRGIHIELIASLSTDSAIMAIRRMAARRGMPHTIVSDNGTNFHGADVELRKAYRDWLPDLEKYALRKHVEWRFIDPGAPNQGGAWERMIRSVKSAMLVTLTGRTPKEEVLATLTAEIEHTINSRPLTHVPVSADDPEALTPNHFLLGTAVGLPFVGNCAVADRRSWRAAQALADIFWKRWINEYLPTLAPRGDNRDNRDNVKPGDVVIVADGLLPRNVWPRGLVEKVYVGPDGVVRSAEVRTKGGIFRRPVCRLIVLPVDCKGSEGLRRGETVADN